MAVEHLVLDMSESKRKQEIKSSCCPLIAALTSLALPCTNLQTDTWIFKHVFSSLPEEEKMQEAQIPVFHKCAIRKLKKRKILTLN